MNARIVLSTSLLALAGCAAVAGIGDVELVDQSPATPSSGQATDPAASAPIDAADGATPGASPPGSSIVDASADAGVDATVTDADAGILDAAIDIPPVAEPDDPPGPGRCGFGDFDDRRADAATRSIAFPIAGGYDPRCMTIRAGQSVTFIGDLALYPLGPRGNGPGPAQSPIVLTTTGTSVTFTFPARGRFRFGSPGSPTLRGTIDVRP